MNGQTEKSMFFQALKNAGVPLAKPYREYTVAELKQAWEFYQQQVSTRTQPEGPPPEPQATTRLADEAPPVPEFLASAPAFREQLQPGAIQRDPDERAGQRLNSQLGEPIRTDEAGRIWYQEEVTKPAIPTPRARRVLRYQDTGVQQVNVLGKHGEVTESFEIAGNETTRTAEVKITLPSYQVGIYKDPRFPFRVYCYNGKEGFDLFEVQQYYGGAELVPEGVKRMYVENVLCYDIRTVIRDIQTQYRQLQLAGQIR